MTKIAFLGSCREVGRSGILITSNNGTKCVLDYGIRFHSEERLPQDFNRDKLKAVALTHAHVDHSGALPYLYKKNNIPFLTNPISLRIAEILIKDTLRISKYNYPFGYEELDNLRKNATFLNERVRQRIEDDFYITFFNAGHIPGSVSILVEVDDKVILYSGDINTQNTNLCTSAEARDFPPIDALIIESTYALRNHPPRETLEKDFVEKIIDIISNGGRVLIPAFAVARSQEVLLILNKYFYKEKIYIDGLARKISNKYLNHPEAIKDFKVYKKALKKAKYVSRSTERNSIKKRNAVFIASSGMLKGGAVMEYMGSILKDPMSAIYIVGYQVEGSPGRVLLDTGVFEFNNNGKTEERNSLEKIQAECEYEYFDFSSHADANNLQQYVKDLQFRNGAKEVFCVHGDEKSTTNLASVLSKDGFNSVAPETGEEYRI